MVRGMTPLNSPGPWGGGALTPSYHHDILGIMSNQSNQSNADNLWRFYHTIEVRFRDIDMFGHANNAAYLTYFESARVAYYTNLTGLTDPREFGMTVAGAQIDFLKPIFYGQTVHVYTRIGRVGTKSWTLEHEICDAQTGDLLAKGHTVNVHYNYKTQKSLLLPTDLIEKMEAFEGRKLRET